MESKISKNIFDRSVPENTSGTEPEKQVESQAPPVSSPAGVSSGFGHNPYRQVHQTIATLLAAIRKGDIDARADVRGVDGSEREILENINEILETMNAPVSMAVTYIKRIAQGSIPEKITREYPGAFSEVRDAINQCIDSLTGVIEIHEVLQRMSANDHSRGVEGKYPGVFDEIARGINYIRRQMIRITDSIENVSRGDLGDLERYRHVDKRSENDRVGPSFNAMMKTIKGVVEEVTRLTDTAMEGRLHIRGNAEKFGGEYAKIIQGFNNTLDVIIEPLRQTADYIEMISRGHIPEKSSAKE